MGRYEGGEGVSASLQLGIPAFELNSYTDTNPLTLYSIGL